MVEVKGIKFDVIIEKKRIKNTYLRIRDNIIVATCPYHVQDYEVYKFIESKKNWVYKVYLYNQFKLNNTYLYRGGDTFKIFGEDYIFIRSLGRKKVSIVNNTIYFTYKDDSQESIKSLYKELDKMLLKKANDYFEIHRELLLDYGYKSIPLINAHIMTSRWGVCYTKKNKISISSYLIHYPEKCLEYIIVHEMTHLIIPNHSKRFYDIVSNNMPDYKDADKVLKLM